VNTKSGGVDVEISAVLPLDDGAKEHAILGQLITETPHLAVFLAPSR
jgi:hypothetical protein